MTLIKFKKIAYTVEQFCFVQEFFLWNDQSVDNTRERLATPYNARTSPRSLVLARITRTCLNTVPI